jgi:hypothetical protein
MIEKVLVVVEQQIGERVYRLELPLGAPFSECIDAASDLLKQVIEMSKRQPQQPDAQASQEPINAEITD